MTADNAPTWMARYRPQNQTGILNSRAERDFSKAKRAQGRRLTKRLVQDGERRYTAYSLDELIEIQSQSEMGRPGHFGG